MEEMGGCQKSIQTSSCRMNKLWGSIVNNSVLYMYIKFAKKVNLKCCHHKIKYLCELMKVLTYYGNHFICVSNHHVVHLIVTQCYMSVITQQSCSDNLYNSLQ